jgi:hypothetical protein
MACYPDTAEVNEFLHFKPSYYPRNENVLNETHLTKNSTLLRATSLRFTHTESVNDLCHVSTYHVHTHHPRETT